MERKFLLKIGCETSFSGCLAGSPVIQFIIYIYIYREREREREKKEYHFQFQMKMN